jgi:hypothetical protein
MKTENIKQKKERNTPTCAWAETTVGPLKLTTLGLVSLPQSRLLTLGPHPSVPQLMRAVWQSGADTRVPLISHSLALVPSSVPCCVGPRRQLHRLDRDSTEMSHPPPWLAPTISLGSLLSRLDNGGERFLGRTRHPTFTYLPIPSPDQRQSHSPCAASCASAHHRRHVLRRRPRSAKRVWGDRQTA